MRLGISFILSEDDRERLEALVADRNAPQKHVWRTRTVRLSADGLGANAIMAATGKAKTCLWHWQERFMAEGCSINYLPAVISRTILASSPMRNPSEK